MVTEISAEESIVLLLSSEKLMNTKDKLESYFSWIIGILILIVATMITYVDTEYKLSNINTTLLVFIPIFVLILILSYMRQKISNQKRKAISILANYLSIQGEYQKENKNLFFKNLENQSDGFIREMLMESLKYERSVVSSIK